MLTPPSVPQELTGAENLSSRCQRDEMRRAKEIRVVYVNEGWKGNGKWVDRRVGIARWFACTTSLLQEKLSFSYIKGCINPVKG